MQTNSSIKCLFPSEGVIFSNWEEFSQKFYISEHLGPCVPEYHKIPQQFKIWYTICQELPILNSTGNIKSAINNLELVTTETIVDHYDLLISVSLIMHLTNSYLFHDKNNIPQSLPKQLAIPLNDICTKLGVKPSFGYIQTLFNWQRKDSSISHMALSNLSYRYSFTGTDDERIFFMLPIFADFCFGSIIRAIFECNKAIERCDIDGVIHFLKVVDDSWQTIIENMHYMKVFNDPKEFYFGLRRYLSGCHDKAVFPNKLQLEGVEGDNSKIDTEGASAGNDPCYQIFERAFGIKFNGDLANMENIFLSGFTTIHRDLIKFMENNSRIHDYLLQMENEKIKLSI